MPNAKVSKKSVRLPLFFRGTLKGIGCFLAIFTLYVMTLNAYMSKNADILNISISFVSFSFFFICYFWLVFLDSIVLRWILVVPAYIVISVTISDITILNPLIGIVSSDKTIDNDPLLKSLRLAYIILMLLVLFSLQKTARKNSIIPS